MRMSVWRVTLCPTVRKPQGGADDGEHGDLACRGDDDRAYAGAHAPALAGRRGARPREGAVPVRTCLGDPLRGPDPVLRRVVPDDAASGSHAPVAHPRGPS